MSLVNFSDASLAHLRAILGSFGDDEIKASVKTSQPYLESRWYKVTAEVEVTEGKETNYEYKAEEVEANGEVVSEGIVFDSDKQNSGSIDDPIYLPNLKLNSDLYTGAIEVGKAYQIEAYYSDQFEVETEYYIIPKGGGGTNFFYAIFKSNEGGQDYLCDVYPDGLFNSEGEFEADALVRVFNVDYGEILPNTKLKCWPADSNEIGIKYYAEAPTWQQDLP